MVEDVHQPVAESIALKEWAVLVDALARGDILALVRKGGIREQRGGFSVRHDRFLLYPTYFHEKAEELAERFRPLLGEAHARRPPEGMIRLAFVADVLAVWRVTELDRLRGIGNEHGLAWRAVEARFRYRDRPLVHVAAVRVSRLPQPVEIAETRRYLGCVSWVRLDQPVELNGAMPLHDRVQITERVERLAGALGAPLQDTGFPDAQRAGELPTRG